MNLCSRACTRDSKAAFSALAASSLLAFAVSRTWTSPICVWASSQWLVPALLDQVV